MKGIVYIAGPMTIGDREENLAKGLAAAEKIWKLGFVPFVPHLSFFYNDSYFHTWEEWLEYDETIIGIACCAVLRVEGESKGADREEEFARQYNIPVFYEHKAFEEWAQERDQQPDQSAWKTIQGTTINYGDQPTINRED